jgi:predicted O-linked N-acetylglucosamine transferase (SPINDLY family)
VSALPDDTVTRVIAAGMDEFRRCGGLDSREVARMVREDGIDVLVDLGGYQMDARLEVFALGAAPVQVAWLGYPGSTGLAGMTHALVDEVACPHGGEAAWTESLVRLPGTYFLGGDGRVPESPALTREGLGLPADAVVLCAFNQPWKIEPRVFGCWMEVLRRVPEAVLWFHEPASHVGANVLFAAREAGIDPSRLVFAPAWPHDRHLARYRFADLFLDSWVCNAHTTAADALAADVPIVSLAGDAFHQRVGASLLGALGCGELVATDPAGYLERAVALARDPVSRRRWSVRLREGRGACDLFAPTRKARVLEDAYRSLVAVI